MVAKAITAFAHDNSHTRRGRLGMDFFNNVLEDIRITQKQAETRETSG